MFTGIVESRGRVTGVDGDATKRLVITKPSAWRLTIGGSIAVDGVCLTVTKKTRSTFSCDIVPETIRRSTFNTVSRGRSVNLERPLKVGDELGGHIVLGHVDGRAKVVALHAKGASREMTFDASARLMRSIREKGSVAINGVSLTVAGVRGSRFTVALIPHTLAMTTMGELSVGDAVNIEVDHLARSVAALRRK